MRSMPKQLQDQWCATDSKDYFSPILYLLHGRVLCLVDGGSLDMNKSRQSSKDMHDGHQDPKRGQTPNDPQNRERDNPQKQGVNDSKEGQQRQGIGTPHEQNEKKEHQSR